MNIDRAALERNDLVGSWRRFGKLGPVYEVLREVNHKKVRIRVLETGEELEYPTSEVLADPRER
jgi:hypothetical protein